MSAYLQAVERCGGDKTTTASILAAVRQTGTATPVPWSTPDGDVAPESIFNASARQSFAQRLKHEHATLLEKDIQSMKSFVAPCRSGSTTSMTAIPSASGVHASDSFLGISRSNSMMDPSLLISAQSFSRSALNEQLALLISGDYASYP